MYFEDKSMNYKRIGLVALIAMAPIVFAANVIISPNMGMPVPVVGTAPGPEWANDINASLSIIDSHDHTPGYGVAVPPAGLNINSDLTFQSHNATNLRSARFTAQGSPLSGGGADLGAVYVSGADLYYNDENGNQVRITQGGSVTGSSGTITGLPSGTASASFSAGTFTFQGATNTPATMAIGPAKIGAAVANAKTVTIAPPGGLATNYNLTLPSALPSGTAMISIDNAGNMATVNTTGAGVVVLNTAPVLAGGTLNGTFSGSPTFSGNAIFNGGIDLESSVAGSPSFTGSPAFGAISILTSVAGNPTFTGNPTFNAGAGFAGTISGSPTFSGAPTFSGVPSFPAGFAASNNITGNPTFTGTPTFGNGAGMVGTFSGSPTFSGSNPVFSGNPTIGGNLSINGTGGNTPHNCTTRTTLVSSSQSATANCNAGEIVTGGGCSATTFVSLSDSNPSGSTAWHCAWASASNVTAYAMCCSI